MFWLSYIDTNVNFVNPLLSSSNHPTVKSIIFIFSLMIFASAILQLYTWLPAVMLVYGCFDCWDQSNFTTSSRMYWWSASSGVHRNVFILGSIEKILISRGKFIMTIWHFYHLCNVCWCCVSWRKTRGFSCQEKRKTFHLPFKWKNQKTGKHVAVAGAKLDMWNKICFKAQKLANVTEITVNLYWPQHTTSYMHALYSMCTSRKYI